MELQTEHKGYDLKYRESEDSWHCFDLRLSNKSLARLKSAIDTVERDARRLDNIKVVTVSGYSETGKVVEATTLTEDGEGVWITYTDRRSNTAKREKRNLKDTALATPENLEKVKEWARLEMEVRILQKKARELLESIPRATAEQLKPQEEKHND